MEAALDGLEEHLVAEVGSPNSEWSLEGMKAALAASHNGKEAERTFRERASHHWKEILDGTYLFR